MSLSTLAIKRYMNSLMYARVRVRNIEWDTDGAKVKLPDEAVVEIKFGSDNIGRRIDNVPYFKDGTVLEELVNNALSDKYGFTHFGYEIVGILYMEDDCSSLVSYDSKVFGKKEMEDEKFLTRFFELEPDAIKHY